MPFVEYSYYTEQAGGKLPEDEFSRLICKACSYVQYMTMGRGCGNTDGEKLAACAIVDVYDDAEQRKENGSAAIKSENNDGYSVTYVTEQKDGEAWEETLSRKAYQVARPYLLPTGLLYRGMNR